MRTTLILAATAISLTACERAPEPGASPATSETAAVPSSSAPSAAPSPMPTDDVAGAPDAAFDCAPFRAAALVPDAERGETGARNVLLEWGRGLENGRFDNAWCQFADNGQASGRSRSEYAQYWKSLGRLTVAMPTGTLEGAAGSSYYTAPTTITAELPDGTTRTFKGDVVLRRVNDVPGASADQLRWQIRSADLAEVR